MSCPHCFNANTRHGGVMDFDTLLNFFRFNENYLQNSVIKLMGGEPTLHPNFTNILTESCKYYGSVMLFTNGNGLKAITQDSYFLKQHLQDKLSYAINGYTFSIDQFKKYRDFINYVFLHFVILDSTATIEKIIKCMELTPQVHFLISPNTQVDLFDENELGRYREIWLSAITQIIPLFRKNNISYSYDHNLPICFYTQEMIDELHTFDLDDLHATRITCCGENFMGLIDYNFDLYFCNQTRIKIGSVLNSNGTPKYIPEIEKLLQPKSKEKTIAIKNLSNKCRECPVVASCKVGCYYNTMVKHYGRTC
jgi:radical SAM protein with 4Fe4S-binding SPASM domain